MKFPLVLCGILLSLFVYGQQQITLSGYVDDAQTGERLYGATVYLPNQQTGIITNQYGFYSIIVPKGEIIIQASFVGYKTTSRTLSVLKDSVLSFSLFSDNQINEIEVKAAVRTQQQQLHGRESLSMKEVQSLPGFLGENDVLKALTRFPGVQQGHEGSAGVFVRGGSPDQNLILLDGVPVYNATHLFGFVSVFNPEAIQSVDLYKGNFPARFGGRLSSVIDVRMKEGNKYERHTDLTFGMLSSKITHEGPIQKGKSSYLISARRTLLDLLVTGAAKINQQASDEAVVPGLNFYDVNAKLNFALTENDHLYVSIYNGGDRLFSQFMMRSKSESTEQKDYTDVKLKWGNSVFATRWTRQINRRVFMNSSLSSGLFQYAINSKFSQKVKQKNQETENWTSIKYVSQVNTNQAKLHFDWYLNDRHKLKIGSEAGINFFIPGEQQIRKNTSENHTTGNKHLQNFSAAVFAEDQYTISNKWLLNFGLRYDLYATGQKYFQHLSPRMNLDFYVSPRFSLSYSCAEMFQPIHLLTNSSIGLPSDIWVPASANVPPEKSWMQSISACVDLSRKINWVSAAYYKTMQGVITYQAGSSFMDMADDWESLIERGKGRAWGWENSLNLKLTKLEGWVNYTLSWNQRRYAGLNHGRYFPYKFDRRHDFNIGFIWNLSSSVDLSAMWVFQTGQAATIAGQDYPGVPGLLDGSFSDFITGEDIKDYDRIQLFENRNNYRLPAFHHLDLSLTIKRQMKKTQRELKVGFYNVYARQNPYMYYPRTMADGTRKYRQVCIFPFLPSVSYRIIF